MNKNDPQKPRVLTRQEARQRLVSQGITIRQWARERELSERTVYEVLNGAQKGFYGHAHKVAVLLGMKEEWSPNEHQ